MSYSMYQRHYGVPLSYDLTTFQILGQKFSNFFVGILVQTMTPKGHFEINWPLPSYDARGLKIMVWMLSFLSVQSGQKQYVWSRLTDNGDRLNVFL